jgi:hypothetical protein
VNAKQSVESELTWEAEELWGTCPTVIWPDLGLSPGLQTTASAVIKTMATGILQYNITLPWSGGN